MKDSKNDYDWVQSMDEGYIREVGSISIARALIFLLEAPSLSVSGGSNHRLLPIGKSSNQVTSHLSS